MAYDKPNYFGGPTTNVRRLLPALHQRGHEVHALIFFHEDSPTSRYLASKGVHCHALPKPRYIETRIEWILKRLIDIDPDIFVPNVFVSGWYAARWAQSVGIPSIAAHRSDEAYYWGMVERFIVGSSPWRISGLLCVNNHLKSRVEALGANKTKIRVIPSGVPIPAKVSSQSSPLKVVYVGRLVQKQKRIHETLEALLKVTKLLPDVTITFIGDGVERDSLERKTQSKGLTQRIKFIGAIPSEKLAEELINHHVLVLLSDYEGTPGAVMDAMACGLVPVCMDIKGGVQDLIQQGITGFLVKDRSDDFLETIQRLSANSHLREKIALAAKQHIVDSYSVTVMTDKWESFFEEMLEDSSSHTSIKLPARYDLLPVHPSLSLQDRRLPWWRRVFSFL